MESAEPGCREGRKRKSEDCLQALFLEQLSRRGHLGRGPGCSGKAESRVTICSWAWDAFNHLGTAGKIVRGLWGCGTLWRGQGAGDRKKSTWTALDCMRLPSAARGESKWRVSTRSQGRIKSWGGAQEAPAFLQHSSVIEPCVIGWYNHLSVHLTLTWPVSHWGQGPPLIFCHHV